MKVIDVHTHGMGGLDTSAASEDQILEIARLQRAAGVDEIVLTLYPAPVDAMRRAMTCVRKAMEIQKATPGGQQDGSKIIGVHLEGPFLNPSQCGALNADALMEPRRHTLDRLISGFEDMVRIMTLAPELDGAVDVIRLIADRGIVASMGHSEATCTEAEAGFHSGARGITHLFNAMRGIHHREPGIAGFGLMNRDIYVEVIADPFHLDSRMIELIFDVKDPGKVLIVSDSVRDSKTGAHPEGIRGSGSKLLGGSMPIRESAERLIAMGMDEQRVMAAITVNPEQYLTL